jgi:hypothetical protein
MPIMAQKGKGRVRTFAMVVAITFGIVLVAEFGAWLLEPDRYNDPPPVTADAWIYSDALPSADTVWMKEFVDEFCRSYDARWASYVYFRRKPFSGRHINVDSNGIRYTPQFSVRQNEPAVRLFLLGGSTMWGTGARDSLTIPSQLSRRIALDPECRPVHVVNMGESGYVSTQSIVRLELELQKGNVPEIVILYEGANDVYATYQNHAPGLPQNESHRATEFNLLKEGGRMRRLGLEDLLGRTLLASVVRSVQKALADTPAVSPPPLELAGDVVRLYAGNLVIVDALSKHFGFHYETYWQPVVFSKKSPSPYEKRQSLLQQTVRPFFEEVYRRVKDDSVLRTHARFHDLSGIFDSSDRPVYLDFCHICEAGNAIIAERMYDDIKPFLRRGR